MKNSTILNGILVSVPKVSIVDLGLGEKKIFVAKFVVGCYDEEHHSSEFFECLACGNTARILQSEYKKNAEITVFGRLKNFIFKDFNQTGHYTNVILAEQIGDGVHEYEMVEKEIDKETRELYEEYSGYLNDCYHKLCENGYLCVDEDDYYDILFSNFDFE